MENIIALINQCSTDKEIADLLNEKLIEGSYYMFFNEKDLLSSKHIFRLKSKDVKIKISSFSNVKYPENFEIYVGSYYLVRSFDESISVIKKEDKNTLCGLTNHKLIEISEYFYKKVVQEFERQSAFKSGFLSYLNP